MTHFAPALHATREELIALAAGWAQHLVNAEVATCTSAPGRSSPSAAAGST